MNAARPVFSPASSPDFLFERLAVVPPALWDSSKIRMAFGARVLMTSWRSACLPPFMFIWS